MRRVPILSAPPSIRIDDEPLDGGAALAAIEPPTSTDAFDLVPAWQARRQRRVPRLWGAVPVLAVAALALSWVTRGHDASALRERPSAAAARAPAGGGALVVSAAPALPRVHAAAATGIRAGSRPCRRDTGVGAC